MDTITERTVSRIAIEDPSSVRVFESLGIDYCCGGKRTLSEACSRADVPLEHVLELLENAARAGQVSDLDGWSEATLRELIAHIVGNYHENTRRESARIGALLQKVVSRHAAAHPEVLEIEALFVAIVQELLTHMLKEEQVLFPHIERMEVAAQEGKPLPQAFFGSVARPITKMLAEHDDAGHLVARIRELSNVYAPPADACPTFRALYHALAEFERELHSHVHLENNVLFPRAVKLEEAAA